jgi:hypothetical protein
VSTYSVFQINRPLGAQHCCAPTIICGSIK